MLLDDPINHHAGCIGLLAALSSLPRLSSFGMITTASAAVAKQRARREWVNEWWEVSDCMKEVSVRRRSKWVVNAGELFNHFISEYTTEHFHLGILAAQSFVGPIICHATHKLLPLFIFFPLTRTTRTLNSLSSTQPTLTNRHRQTNKKNLPFTMIGHSPTPSIACPPTGNTQHYVASPWQNPLKNNRFLLWQSSCTQPPSVVSPQ